MTTYCIPKKIGERKQGTQRAHALEPHFLSGKPCSGAQPFYRRNAILRKCYENWVVKSWAKGHQAEAKEILSTQAQESMRTGDMRPVHQGNPDGRAQAPWEPCCPALHGVRLLPAWPLQPQCRLSGPFPLTPAPTQSVSPSPLPTPPRAKGCLHWGPFFPTPLLCCLGLVSVPVTEHITQLFSCLMCAYF